MKDKYPFEEGDDYWTVENRQVAWSCWDDISQQMYSEDTLYFKSNQDAERHLKLTNKQKL